MIDHLEYDVTTHILVIGDRRWNITIKDSFNKVDPYIVVWSWIKGQNNNQDRFQGFWRVKKLKTTPNKDSVIALAKTDSLI